MHATSVLVVEDNPLVRRAYERVLAEQHSVVSVGNGDEALAQFGRQRFSAVVSDIDLPGLSGIDLLKAVRRVDNDVPFVIVTGCPSLESAQDAVNFGAFRYLTKPVDASTLLETVGRAARHAELAALSRGAAKVVEQAKTDGDADAELRTRLDSAMSSLWMAFQPIVSWTRQGIVGYEALLRTEEKSLARPPDLLEAADRLGRLTELGRRVRALVAERIPLLPKGASVFVNLHARDLEDADLHDPASPLARHAQRVVLEITERASVDHVKDLASAVISLRRLGFRLAIDDLGAGYAGLTSVTHLEPDVVKLDMSLVRGVDSSHVKQELVRSIVRVCLELGMTVVTEGVETPRERDTLLRLGCDVFQGYLFGRPAREMATPTF